MGGSVGPEPRLEKGEDGGTERIISGLGVSKEAVLIGYIQKVA